MKLNTLNFIKFEKIMNFIKLNFHKPVYVRYILKKKRKKKFNSSAPTPLTTVKVIFEKIIDQVYVLPAKS